MKRFIMRGIITVLLLWASLSFLLDILPTGIFIIRNLFAIIAGEVDMPTLKKTSVVTIFAMPILFFGLVSLIPRKDGSYSDDEEPKN